VKRDPRKIEQDFNIDEIYTGDEINRLNSINFRTDVCGTMRHSFYWLSKIKIYTSIIYLNI
jgi:hypothetical protein